MILAARNDDLWDSWEMSMRANLIVSGCLMACLAAPAFANCTTGLVSGGNDLNTLLNGSLICGRPGAGYSGAASDRWQEQHRTNGQLWDHKLGVGNAVDPESQVGTWSATSGANATYTANYSGVSYTYQVYLISGNTYSFCIGASEQVVATVTANQGTAGNGCSGFP
jgi:hypothetical protein